MPTPEMEWTLDMVHALPDDGNRYELLDGELLVSPAPSWRHQDVQLLLAVEVLSPATARNDRYKKRAVYQEEGVPEYWIVDPGARLVERWRPGDAEPEVLLTALAWEPIDGSAPLVIDLEALFREAMDE